MPKPRAKKSGVKHEGRHRKRLPKKGVTKLCLNCQRPFTSYGNWNRKCDRCNEEASKLGRAAYTMYNIDPSIPKSELNPKYSDDY